MVCECNQLYCTPSSSELDRAVILSRAVCGFFLFSHFIQLLPCTCKKDSSDLRVSFELFLTTNPPQSGNPVCFHATTRLGSRLVFELIICEVITFYLLCDLSKTVNDLSNHVLGFLYTL